VVTADALAVVAVTKMVANLVAMKAGGGAEVKEWAMHGGNLERQMEWARELEKVGLESTKVARGLGLAQVLDSLSVSI